MGPHWLVVFTALFLAYLHYDDVRIFLSESPVRKETWSKVYGGYARRYDPSRHGTAASVMLLCVGRWFLCDPGPISLQAGRSLPATRQRACASGDEGHAGYKSTRRFRSASICHATFTVRVQMFAARPSARVATDTIGLWKEVVREFGNELEIAIKVNGHDTRSNIPWRMPLPPCHRTTTWQQSASHRQA